MLCLYIYIAEDIASWNRIIPKRPQIRPCPRVGYLCEATLVRGKGLYSD